MGACTKPESGPRDDPREGAKPKGSGSRRSSIPGNKQNANLALFDTNETARRRRESTLPAGYDGNQLTEDMLNGERFKAFKADRKDLAATCTVCDVEFGPFRYLPCPNQLALGVSAPIHNFCEYLMAMLC